MNKKLKYLSIIPLYGTCILFIYLFVLNLKARISKKKFFQTFIICAIVSAVCWYMVMMIMYIMSEKIIAFDFNSVGIILTMIIAGYMMNAFSFIYVDKNWDSLFYYSILDASFIDVKKLFKIGFVGAIVIIVLTFATILAFGWLGNSI